MDINDERNIHKRGSRQMNASKISVAYSAARHRSFFT
jgi:hypothetical protein